MPLTQGKSNKAFKKNVETEMESGKPQKQSLAIAYNIQRKNKPKMAQGGEVKPKSLGDIINYPSGPSKAHGGMIDSEDHYDSIADAILSKKRKAMADGGMADVQENGEEEPNEFDDMNEEAIKKELYDDSQLSPQPEDSNEHGDNLEDEDSHDMVESARKKLMLKRKMG